MIVRQPRRGNYQEVVPEDLSPKLSPAPLQTTPASWQWGKPGDGFQDGVLPPADQTKLQAAVIGAFAEATSR